MRIPSTVPAITSVHGQKLKAPTPILQSENTLASSPHSEPISNLSKTPPVVSFLERLRELIENLPNDIPEATDYDQLAIFAGHPEQFDDPAVDVSDLWETSLNQRLKSVLGWGREGNVTDIIRRGRKGMDGLYNFIKYFTIKRGVSEDLFEGKLSHLMSAMEKLR